MLKQPSEGTSVFRKRQTFVKAFTIYYEFSSIKRHATVRIARNVM